LFSLVARGCSKRVEKEVVLEVVVFFSVALTTAAMLDAAVTVCTLYV